MPHHPFDHGQDTLSSLQPHGLDSASGVFNVGGQAAGAGGELDAPRLVFTQPAWYPEWRRSLPECVPSIVDRMRIVNDAARRNFEAGTGGPFAAAVFDSESGTLVLLVFGR